MFPTMFCSSDNNRHHDKIHAENTIMPYDSGDGTGRKKIPVWGSCARSTMHRRCSTRRARWITSVVDDLVDGRAIRTSISFRVFTL